MKSRTLQLKQEGQSIWLDNIQRRELHDGTIQHMINQDGVCGITSNPTIFMNAVTKSDDYDDQIALLTGKKKSAEEIYYHITVDDIRDAGNLFLPVYRETQQQDGYVSIELNPQLAFDIEGSIREAREVLKQIGLPNIMVKVPGTPEGISVARQLIAEGINVNITLLFSPDRYKQVAVAYIEGLEQRAEQGKDISRVRSVASFFISRIDSKVDKQIDEICKKDESVLSLRGAAATTIAKVTYRICENLFSGERFGVLKEKGAHIQRVLWASTSTKDPSYRDVKYVEDLVADNTINTLPPKTIDAFRDHGIARQTITEGIDDAPGILKRLEQSGVSLEGVYNELQDEGVRAFETSYLELLDAIEKKGKALLPQAAG